MGIAFVATSSSGKFVSLKDAVIPVSDLIVQRAFGINEVLVAYDKTPFALDSHLKRLARSANLIKLRLPRATAFIRNKILAGLKKVNGRNILIKIIITGGDGRVLIPDGEPRLFILFSPFHFFPEKYYQQGVKVKTNEHLRILPEVKSMNYFWAVLAHREALRNGFDEVLYLDRDQNILEGTTFNFGIIKNKKLIAPKQGVLAGITMEVACGLAKKSGLIVRRRKLKYSELKTADEAFLTSTVREISPVARVDKIKIGNGKPGKYTKLLLQAYRGYVQRFTAAPRVPPHPALSS